jgi:hypothetical protein
MTRLLAPTLILLAVILLAVNVPALAVDRTFQIEIENSLKGTVPPSWWLHASWRDQTLVVFVSPPVQESFDLWYDTPRQKETLENLCKAIPGARHRSGRSTASSNCVAFSRNRDSRTAIATKVFHS